MFGKVFNNKKSGSTTGGESNNNNNNIDGGSGDFTSPPATPKTSTIGTTTSTTTSTPLFMSPGASDPDFVPPPDAVSLVQQDIEDGKRGDLERQVRDRDSTISTLERTRLEKQSQLLELQKELELEKLRQMKEQILHTIEVERLQRQTRAIEERLIALEKDMNDKDAIYEYANLIKGVAPKGGVDSQYVMKLQSQLAKAVKKMDVTANQMVQVEQSCEEIVNSLKKEILHVVEDRCQTELELRKQLELLQEQKVDMENEYDDRIQENQKEILRLKLKVTSNSNNKDDVDEPTVEELETELEETETKLEQLNQIHEMQERTIEELKETLDTNNNNDNNNNSQDEDDDDDRDGHDK